MQPNERPATAGARHRDLCRVELERASCCLAAVQAAILLFPSARAYLPVREDGTWWIPVLLAAQCPDRPSEYDFRRPVDGHRCCLKRRADPPNKCTDPV